MGSLLIHAGIMFFIPKPTHEVPPPKQEIRIELVKQEENPVAAPPVAVPEPPAPEPPKPPPPEPAKPQVPNPPPKPVEPKPVEPRPQPTLPQKVSSMPEPPTEPAQPVPETSTPAVITATPSESKPAEVPAPSPAPPVPPAPPPEVPKVTGPSEGDINAARNAFRNAAHRELKKNQRYPRIAQDRGIEGDVKLSINIDDQGNITGIEVIESSGNKAIDDAAVTAAQKSQLKPHFNEILRGKVNNIVVTVSFKLSS